MSKLCCQYWEEEREREKERDVGLRFILKKQLLFLTNNCDLLPVFHKDFVALFFLQNCTLKRIRIWNQEVVGILMKKYKVSGTQCCGIPPIQYLSYSLFLPPIHLHYCAVQCCFWLCYALLRPVHESPHPSYLLSSFRKACFLYVDGDGDSLYFLMGESPQYQ